MLPRAGNARVGMGRTTSDAAINDAAAADAAAADAAAVGVGVTHDAASRVSAVFEVMEDAKQRLGVQVPVDQRYGQS